MQTFVRVGGSILIIALLATIYLAFGTRGLAIQLALPEEGEEGFVVDVGANYIRDGKRQTEEIYEGVVGGDATISAAVRVAMPWNFASLRTQVRHPFYRPTTHYAMGNPHWRNLRVTAEPELWSRSHDYYLVPPSEETTMAALDHLRWLRVEYPTRVPPHIFVSEIRRAQLMLGSLAFAGGEKEGGWESNRRIAVQELNLLADLVESLTYEPCPVNYDSDPSVPIVCGRTGGNLIRPE